MAFVKQKPDKIFLDLNGQDGNAFVLLGTVTTLGTQLGWTAEKIRATRAEMMAGNYKNLVLVLERELGDFLDIVLPRNWNEYE